MNLFSRRWYGALIGASILAGIAAATWELKSAFSQSINISGPSAGGPGGYPPGAHVLTAVATGTGSVVSATMGGGSVGYITYICGFSVGAIGVVSPIPITIGGVKDHDLQYIAISTVAGGPIASQNWYPCLPASDIETSMEVRTNSNPGAATVKINMWGFEIPS